MNEARMREGYFVAVVGPSGAGKDTVLNAAREALQNDQRFHFTKRIITRPNDGGNEDHTSTDEESFIEAAKANHYALHWQAHGLYYALPATLDAELVKGRVAIGNLSRQVLAEARQRYRLFSVAMITAKPAILAERLALRGRESYAEIKSRLEREVPVDSTIEHVVLIDNSGDIKQATDRFIEHLLELCECTIP